MSRGRALACVLGDMDLVRPLGLAGIPVAVGAPRGDPARFSRFVRDRFELQGEDGPEAETAALLAQWAAGKPAPPALFYEDDWNLLLVSRRREELARHLRFVVAEAELVEDLVDKERFQALAERAGLPVPRARAARPAHEPAPVDEFAYPVLLKPVPARNARWRAVEPDRKALSIADAGALRDVWARLGDGGVEVLLQELIPGPESRIESHHVYVDERGDIVAQFTGRKIRTFPTELGHSTALEITDSPDVEALGGELVGRLGLTGVAKADFKRAPDGTLHLLEINPRFTLWAHLAAKAGLNLPAVVYADLVSEPRPALRRARVGATWSRSLSDLKAVRAEGGSTRRWLRWLAGCEAVSLIAPDDPLPFLAGKVWGPLRDRVAR
jgi:predicted ATP-grasp superfamily ATP-dependent carboligase